MESIRKYDGEVRLCGSCGQPCYLGPTECGEMWQHFHEQWDGIHCERFPLAEKPIPVGWNWHSLEGVKRSYPDTSPYALRKARASGL